MGFMLPCCMCGRMLTSFVQKSAFKITRQVKFNHKGEVTVDQELDHERPVCDSCVVRMENEGHVFDWSAGTVVKHYAEDKTSALIPTPDIPLPPATKVRAAPKKRDYTTYKDVQLAYLLHGAQGLDSLRESKRVPKVIFKRAYYMFKREDRKVDLAPFEDWFLRELGSFGRGRASPVKGQNRRYRAQQVKRGDPFIRLPVASLDVWKGRLVDVQFEEDRIVVRPL